MKITFKAGFLEDDENNSEDLVIGRKSNIPKKRKVERGLRKREKEEFDLLVDTKESKGKNMQI